MRRLVAAGLLLASVAALAACGASKPPPASIEIRPSMPFADSEDDNPLGLRIWSLAPQVVVRFRRACDRADYSSSARTWLNRGPGHWAGGNGADHQRIGRVRAGTVVTRDVELDAYAGQTVRLRVRVRCGARKATASRTFRLPAVSCADGFLHVYELRGRADWIDERWGDRPRWQPLRAGDLVESEDGIRVHPGGHATVGAAECNGLQVELGPGEYGVGGYRSDARGEWFSGNRATVTADAHAGGWALAKGLQVLPLGTRCHGCATAAPSTFEFRGARVRVVVGSVVARAAGRGVRVRAGEEAGAVCASASNCRLVGPRVFQPDEPWTTALAAAEPRLAPLVTAPAGATPPGRELAPPFSKVEVHTLPAAGGAPEQLAVDWTRQHRTRADETVQEAGVLVWQRVAPTRWRIVYARRVPEHTFLGLLVGDVTGDGHADVFVNEWNGGTGYCGSRRLVASAGGRMRTLFARATCETEFRLARGALVVDEPVGPCPFARASAHCSGGTRHLVMRWSGARLVERRATVTCVERRLDPARGCRPRRK